MITNLRLQQFRSYFDATFEFGPGVNIIVGPNGSGKTNLLEALQVVLTGYSYRVSDQDLVMFDRDWFRLDATHDDITRVIKCKTNPRLSKTVELNEKSYRSFTHEHTVPVVLFEPNHLTVLQGSPEFRRKYLDDILTQTIDGYSSYLKQYRRVLTQRNALLKKSKTPSAQELFPWNLRLSELGAYISRSRLDLVSHIANMLPELYKILSHSDKTVGIAYEAQFSPEAYESSLMHKLENSIEKDVLRGFTAYGPHREDFTVTFDGYNAQEVASRGEIRTVLLVLKIIELDLVEAARKQTPILLLDDVFSELDGARRKALTAHLENRQTFLTTTDADLAIKHFTSSTILPIG